MWGCCSELAEDVRSGVKRVGLQEAFFVDLGAITKAMRQMHIEAIVRDRFPPIGALRQIFISSNTLRCTPQVVRFSVNPNFTRHPGSYHLDLITQKIFTTKAPFSLPYT